MEALKHIFSIPGYLDVSWSNEVKAVVDRWTNYAVTLDQFKDAILNKGLGYAKTHGGLAWIVDSSPAKGAFTQECQNFIASDIFPAFNKHGIKYFITITSQSAVTRMTIKSYQAKAGPNGFQLVETASVEDAIEWLKQNLHKG
jgi:hypothetical protein